MKRYLSLEKKLEILERKIECLRLLLNESYINEEVSKEEKLKISKEMDNLINEHYKLYNILNKDIEFILYIN